MSTAALIHALQSRIDRAKARGVPETERSLVRSQAHVDRLRAFVAAGGRGKVNTASAGEDARRPDAPPATGAIAAAGGVSPNQVRRERRSPDSQGAAATVRRLLGRRPVPKPKAG